MATASDRQALAGVKDEYIYGFSKPEDYVFKAKKGLNHEVIDQMSDMKREPDWMREFRHRSLDIFLSKPMPTWGADLSGIDFDDIFYYIKPTEKQGKSWDDIPDSIKDTFDRLGIPEAERKFLAGVGAQYESEVVYHSLQEQWTKLGVIFLDTDSGLRDHEDMFKEYFGSIIPPSDNKFAALNSAVWSGGSFIYVPKGVTVDIPLQAYFRINAQNMGQFERTLIVVDEGANVHYVEGCLPVGELVSTGERWVNIESVQPGDTVVNGAGMRTEVQSIRTRPFKGDLVKIRPLSPGNTFQLTPEHPVLAVKREQVRVKRQSRHGWQPEVNTQALRSSQPEYIEAGKLAEGDFLVFPVCKVTHDLPSYTPDVMRLLGYYLAEGSAYVHGTLNMPVVAFSLGSHETEVIDEIKALVERVVGKRAYQVDQEERHATSLTVYSRELMELCIEACGKGAGDKRLSQVMMELPPAKQAQLLETYFRGDGSVYKKGRTMVRASTASPVLAAQLQELLARQGIYASIMIREGGEDTIQGRRIERQDQYVLYYSPDKTHSQVRKADDYFLVPIKAIERLPYDGPVFNFEVVGAPNSYLVRGFAVHNCTAPIYASDSLHSAVVEIIVKKNGRCRYTTIQNWSNNVYNLVTKRAMAQEGATMEWIDGNLGCLAEGSTVTTPSGVRAIQDLNVGDEVLSFDDQAGQLVFRRVLGKRFSGYQPVHTVSVGQRKLQVTANHPFYSYVYDGDAAKKLGRYTLAYVRADHLREAIIPATSVPYGAPYRLQMPELTTQFESSNQYATGLTMNRTRDSRLATMDTTTDDIMWLFGYWVGDGDVEIKEAQTEGVVRWAKVGFSTPVADRARERLTQTMATVIDAEPTERADGLHLSWNSKELAEFLQVNGFTGKANTKRVPAWVWSLPETQRLAFIAGYLDADGYVQPPRSFVLKSVNRDLLEDIASLLVTLGVTSRRHTEFDQPRHVTIQGYDCVAHGAHRLVFPLDRRLLDYVSPRLRQEAEECAPAKLQHHRQVGRSNIVLPECVEIVDVAVSEPTAESVPTWDIEVAGTGNFVSQGFIVHNSKVTMKYPAVYMMGPRAHGEILSIAFAGHGQHQDAGGKVVHGAPNTSSKIISKSISKNGGRASYRGLLKVGKGATGSKSTVVCDALLLDDHSRSDTYPYIEIDEQDVQVGHEASVSKVNEEQLFYLMSRGLSEEEAATMIVSGFIEPMVKELPMEYAVEMNRLIQLQMEGSIG